MSFFLEGGQAFYFKKMINFQYPNSYAIGFPFSQLAPKETTPTGKVHAWQTFLEPHQKGEIG